MKAVGNCVGLAALGLIGAAASTGSAAVIWDTGAPHLVFFESTGADTYLGFTSGNASASQPQRWSAIPFRIPTGGAHLDQIDADWFLIGGSTATQVKYTIWNRSGLAAPVDGDQVSSGLLGAVSAGIDDPRTTDVTDDWLHQYPVDITLGEGDYYLTIYGDNESGTAPATIGWLTGGDLQDEALEQDFQWRSATFPSPGFEVYNPTTIRAGAAMLDAEDRWNLSFTLHGEVIPAPAAGSILALALVGAARRRRS